MVDYQQAAKIINDPNLSEEEKLGRLQLLEEAGTFGEVPIVTGSAPSVFVDDPSLLDPQTAQQLGVTPPPQKLNYSAADTIAIEQASKRGESVIGAPPPPRVSGALQRAQPTPPAPPAPPATGSADDTPRRKSLGTAPAGGGTVPSGNPLEGATFDQLLAASRPPPVRSIRVSDPGYQPRARTTTEQRTELPPLQEFGTPIPVPVGYSTFDAGSYVDANYPDLNEEQKAKAVQLINNNPEYLSNEKANATITNESIYNQLSDITGTPPADVQARMASPDGLVVTDPATGRPALFRLNADNQISIAQTVEVAHTPRIQQRAKQLVEAQREKAMFEAETAAKLRPEQEQIQYDTDQALALNTEKLNKDVAAKQKEIQQAQKKLSEAEIEPQRYMKNQTFGQQLSSIIFMWAAGMAGGIEGFKYASDEIDRLIEQDIDQQLQSIKSDREYIDFLKEEIPYIKDKYQTKEAQIKAVHAAKLGKTIEALKTNRQIAAHLTGQPYRQQEDYELEVAIAEMELRQAEALKEAARAEASTTQQATQEQFDSGVRTVGGGKSLLQQMVEAAEAKKKIDEAYGGGAASDIPFANVVVDPATGERLVAASPADKQSVTQMIRYKNAAINGANDAAQAYLDYQSGKISKAQWEQQRARADNAMVYSWARMVSPEAVSEAGVEEGKTMTTAQRNKLLAALPGSVGATIEGITNPNKNPAELVEAYKGQVEGHAQASIDAYGLMTVEEARAGQRSGFKF